MRQKYVAIARTARRYFRAAASRSAARAGLSRPRLLRQLISYGPHEDASTPSRPEALGLLAASARAGSVPAMVALERALRLAEEPAPLPIRSGPVPLEEARAELKVVR